MGPRMVQNRGGSRVLFARQCDVTGQRPSHKMDFMTPIDTTRSLSLFSVVVPSCTSLSLLISFSNISLFFSLILDDCCSFSFFLFGLFQKLVASSHSNLYIYIYPSFWPFLAFLSRAYSSSTSLSDENSKQGGWIIHFLSCIYWQRNIRTRRALSLVFVRLSQQVSSCSEKGSQTDKFIYNEPLSIFQNTANELI